MKTFWLILPALILNISCSHNEDSMVTESAPQLEQQKDGIISPTAKGGTDAYGYMWSSGSGARNAETLPGTYTVSVTDENGNSTSPASMPIKMPDKIIKTGNVGMEVEDYAKAMASIAAKVKAAQGYISNQSEQRDNYRITNTLSIRVPSQHFDGLMDGISPLAKKLNYKNVYLQDVTEEYTDVTARLKTKKEVEQRYLDILKSAKTIKDVLAVEEQLRVIREEIESSEARLKYLNDQVSYSTIALEVYEELEYTPPAPLQAGFGHKLVSALTNGWNGLLAFIIGLVHLWPFLLVLGAIGMLIIKKWKNRKSAAMA